MYKESFSLIILEPIRNGKLGYYLEDYFVKYKMNELYFTDLNDTEVKVKGYTLFSSDCNKNHHVLLNIKNSNDFVRVNNILDNYVNKIKQKSKKDYCHICNPNKSIKPTKNVHKCQNCEDIFILIHRIDSNKETKDILSIIKQHQKNDGSKPWQEIRQFHYDNLIKYINKIKSYDNVTKNSPENSEKYKLIQELENLVNKTFEGIRRNTTF